MSTKIQVQPENSAVPLAPLSLGIVSGDYLFISGAVAFHPDTRDIVGDTVQEQTVRTLQNIQAVLAAKGLTFDDVVQVRAYLTEPKRDFAAFNETYGEFFAPPYPARTTIGAELAKEGLLVEIDAIAAL